MSLNLEDDLLTTGDPDKIDAALEDMELDDSLLFGDDDEEDFNHPQEHGDDDEISNPTDETAVDDKDVTGSTGEAQPEVIDTTKDSHGDGDHDEGKQLGIDKDGYKEIDGQLYVAVNKDNAELTSKDGKHRIPYEVLEKARKQAGGHSELQKRVQELEGQLNDSNTKRTMFEKQLQEAGLNPDKTPQELLNDPEAMERLKEEYPGEAGQIIAALVQQVQGNQQPVQPVSEQGADANPVNNALESEHLTELKGWMDGDKDRWDMALVIDNKLMESPEFANVPVEQRFAEVQRRVKAAFGDPVQASLDKKEAEKQQAQQPPAQQQKTPIPNSPSALGTGGQDTSQASHEALAAQDPLAMEQAMLTMSDQQLEDFLEQAGMAFD